MTSRGRLTCSGTTFSSPGRDSSGSATASWTASCATWRIRPPPPTSGVRWKPLAARRPGDWAAHSIAARRNPGRSHRSATAARRRCSAASTCSTPAPKGGGSGDRCTASRRHGVGGGGAVGQGRRDDRDGHRPQRRRAAVGEQFDDHQRCFGAAQDDGDLRRAPRRSRSRGVVDVQRGRSVGHPRPGGGVAGGGACGTGSPRQRSAAARDGCGKRLGRTDSRHRRRGVRRRRRSADARLSPRRPAVRVRASHRGDDVRRHLQRAAAALHPADRLGRDQRQTRWRQRVGGHRHARLRRCANRFHARAALDAARLGAAHRRAARGAL